MHNYNGNRSVEDGNRATVETPCRRADHRRTSRCSGNFLLDLYLRGGRFDTLLRPVNLTAFLWFFSVHPCKFRHVVPRLVHDHFFPNTFPFSVL